ncbi:MAG: hypothetical protein ACYDDS_13435 [Candidatus Sulfotelmatobacter sp.]
MSTLSQDFNTVNSQDHATQERIPPQSTNHFEKHDTSNEDRRRAAEAVVYAIRLGRLLPQPCQACGTRENLRAYLENEHVALVTWLCDQHDRDQPQEEMIDLKMWLYCSVDSEEYPTLL